MEFTVQKDGQIRAEFLNSDFATYDTEDIILYPREEDYVTSLMTQTPISSPSLSSNTYTQEALHDL